jgi:hypothetical protein
VGGTAPQPGLPALFPDSPQTQSWSGFGSTADIVDPEKLYNMLILLKYKANSLYFFDRKYSQGATGTL